MLSVVLSSVCVRKVLLGEQLLSEGRLISPWLLGVFVKFPAIAAWFVVEICPTLNLNLKSFILNALLDKNNPNEISPELLALSSDLLFLRPLFLHPLFLHPVFLSWSASLSISP